MKKVIIIVLSVIGIGLFGLLFASIAYTKANEKQHIYEIESIRCENNHYLITTEDSNYRVSSLTYYVDDPAIRGYITITESKEFFKREKSTTIDSVKVNVWYSDIHVRIS